MKLDLMAPLFLSASAVTWMIVAACVGLAGALAYEHWGRR
jgi:hypothetical protein